MSAVAGEIGENV